MHVDNNANDNGGLDIEQVHFTYSFGNGASLTVGQFGSALGLEREDPAGLYTYSRAYSGSDFDLGNIDGVGSQEGFRLLMLLATLPEVFHSTMPTELP